MLCKTCLYFTYIVNDTSSEKRYYCGILVPIKFEAELLNVTECEYYRKDKSNPDASKG
ncbi:MAG: hypothetical protein WC337_11145 [Candidatus Muiribacteriota bacterium]